MSFYKIDDDIRKIDEKVTAGLAHSFLEVERIAHYNQEKVMHAFFENRVSESHFVGTTGYGYDDRGRDVIECIFARVLECEDALVRHSFVSGTHTLCTCMFGLLRPGDTLLSVTGKPYDTLEGVIGISGGEDSGSLKDYNIDYKEVELKEGKVDFEGIRNALTDDVKVVFIQRSKGYDLFRPTLSSAEIGEICKVVKSVKGDVVCMVDNCYGEFVEEHEPSYYGADVIVGSLIKNPGGGIARSGGYIAGRKDLIEKISYRYTSPGVGKECGATLGENPYILRGIFMAPHTVAQAIKTAHFCGGVYKELGYEVSPQPTEKRFDIIQAIKFQKGSELVAFCKGIQMGAPVDSFVTPTPWAMPGYNDEVVMAAGAFIQGASIELSADGPIREPYIAYMQGGLTYESGKLGILLSAQALKDELGNIG